MKHNLFGKKPIQRMSILCAALFLTAAFVFPQTTAARRFPIPGHGELLLQVPEKWKDDIRRPPNDLPPTITFSPAAGSPFAVMLTAGGSAKPGEPLMDADTIRKHVEAVAKNAETQSVEKSLTVKELTGPACRGSYFSATDRAPKFGDYKYMTQGIARTGDVLIAFTVLTNDGQETVVKAALVMLRGAAIRSDSGL